MAADNPHSLYEVLPAGPCRRAVLLTEHDTNELTFVTRYLYVGGAGDVAVLTEAGNTVTFSAVPAGSILPIAAKKLLVATTATLIIGMA